MGLPAPDARERALDNSEEQQNQRVLALFFRRDAHPNLRISAEKADIDD
jgi:hypothetical protein